MRRYDQSSAVCQVFTYKEGLLSAFAHDLRIGVSSFVIEIGDEDDFINARFDAGSLRVDCAMVDGVERPDLLGSWEKEEIDRNIIRDVLDTDTYRDILLASKSVRKEDSTYFVMALLTVRGVAREISFTVKEEDRYLVADVRLSLPDFGIRPFATLFGAVKLKPDILIRVMIPQ